jgi:DnaK suppressor protein
MPSIERDAARVRLQSERTRLLREIGQTIAMPDQMTYGSQAAAATQVFEQERELAMRERAELHLQEVDGALARLDDGSYETCARCSRPIATERLEALPWAAHCIECQTILDRARR